MNQRDELFATGDNQKIWQKYCGFLDFSVKEFMEIQEHLLMEQIEIVADSPLSKKLMNNKRPASVDEFRKTLPFTTYADYASYFNEQRTDVLAVEPVFWARTSARSGAPKWVPYTPDGESTIVDGLLAVLILAGARTKGDVNVRDGVRMLTNLPPRPFISGHLAFSTRNRLDINGIPPIEKAETMEFQEKIKEGFKLAMRSRVDYIGSLSSILVKIGESFVENTGGSKLSLSMLHPLVLYRLIRAKIRSKIENRPVLPKDLWPTRNVICGGMDSVVFSDLVKYYWCKDEPAEMYLSTEAAYVAIQSWNKKGMVFYPYCDFLEFIPEDEWIKSRNDNNYHPSTVLLNELEEGKRYELVITNFHGMPMLRYRIGDLLKITALRDEETGINLPHMVFDSRADDIIDVAQFARVDEKEVWIAIQNTGIKYEDWTIRKEHSENKPFLHLYIALKEQRDAQEVKQLVHEQLKTMDFTYRDLEGMLGLDPLKVTLLSNGTFQNYLEEKQRSGVVELAQLKPSHMNVSDEVIGTLIRISEEVKPSR
jgi:phenylacetate-coenzyme A ligase PaaK-like adenylate-forming protein